MKNTVFLIMGLLVGMSALADDGIKVNPLTIAQGETANLEIMFESAEAKYVGYQFDVNVEGLDFDIDLDEEEGYDAGNALAKSHTIAASVLESNSYRFICTSMKNATIKAGSNVLMTISLKAGAGLEAGTYKVKIYNIEFSDGKSKFAFAPVEASVTVTVPTAIKNLTPSFSQGEGEIYNLQGQRIFTPHRGGDGGGLQKGINIVDGSKVMVK